MLIFNGTIDSSEQLSEKYYLLKIHAPEISDTIKPGQFCNIKVSESSFPLLRRPFSVCDVEGEYIYFMYDLHGEGTRLLSQKQIGDKLDILGPLGNGFNVDGDYDTAVIIAGGIGVAPFPLLTKSLAEKEILTFLGGRTKDFLITYGLENIWMATDDGSEGFNGTVLEMIEKNIKLLSDKKIKLFACGPTPMLKAAQEFSKHYDYECELSTECAMACGFGICQGCPVETEGGVYKLVCKDGPVFNAKEVIL